MRKHKRRKVFWAEKRNLLQDVESTIRFFQQMIKHINYIVESKSKLFRGSEWLCCKSFLTRKEAQCFFLELEEKVEHRGFRIVKSTTIEEVVYET